MKEARRGGGETAVLFRNNESALPLVDLCERRGVPYRFKKADLTFFTHKIVLDAVDFLRFAYEPANGEPVFAAVLQVWAGALPPEGAGSLRGQCPHRTADFGGADP